MLISLFIITLLMAPSPEGESYPMLLQEIGRLNTLINEGEPVGDELEDAIKRLHAHAPFLAADEFGQDLRTAALLNLARARLLAEQPEQAAAAMDQAIGLAHGEALLVADYGPVLETYYEARLAHAAEVGVGWLKVVCTIPCSIYVDEQAAVGVTQVSLGIHRVWIEASAADSTADAEIHRVEVGSAGEVTRLSYSPELPPSEPRNREAPKPNRGRLLPRAAETVMMVIGAGLVIAGATTMGSAADHRMAIGGALLGVGGATLITGGVLCGVDEAAQNGRGPLAKGKPATVMVGWTLRF